MHQVADGVYQIGKGSRAFLIDGDDGVTLIDTGLPGRGRVFLEAIESVGRTVDDVQSMVLTHSHPDHTGGAKFLKDETGAPLYCSSADAPAVDGTAPVPTPPFFDKTPLQVLKPVFGWLPKGDRAQVDHHVDEHFRMQLPEDFIAIDTAGHTPGHTSYLLDRAGGILFVGDAAVQKDGEVKLGFFNKATPAITSSVRTLAEREFAIACFGHAEPLVGGAADAFRRFAAGL